ncbi:MULTISPECIES: 4-demethylwyosine synthase TYW1 [Candidatus Nitrosocaldus]|jgi:tRNA wybutosine-synthesizing protein 1|uniref:S-adenosyl-L-methionine-dependent tRNA 4-demethylwyosine synthase n=1 Tax=Candidatus Nitrosocaldus cavascurensis TaxID=2058097 RepID=A0A2K5AQX6_9ARCH|nr:MULTISPECIES: 4-demethylwyosine synthase TYW1 [Candidatus Nitrosocaldus]SPC34051.1 S-adenosyl-L-methionine-dependent tRNA 4-demethylwyosine synthase [Candidatus Nitrosocaldus cavascurensis]
MSCADEHVQDLIQIKPSIARQLRNAKYGVYNHSTVELCHWTKKSFMDEGTCYKHRFYGIDTHRCMEFSPAGMFCENRCIYCWRPMEFYEHIEMPRDAVDEPQAIIDNLMRERFRLMSGYFGNAGTNKAKLIEAMRPTHYAISLSGEPTMYPKLPGLIRYLKSLKDTRSIFLVTNGQEPEMLYRLEEEDALPTQIYLSTNAPNKRLYYLINKPRLRDAWERWLKSLEFIASTNARTVARITLIRGYNYGLDIAREFAEILRIGNPHFIEVKSYMHVGNSINRLSADEMLSMDEVLAFTGVLEYHLDDYAIYDWSVPSRVVVLQNMKRYVDPIIH